MKFPDHFMWGVASAAYQVEGAAYEDGKGPSVWDMFCRKEGAIWNGYNGDVACDAYHRVKEDVALLKALGIPNYRFSISWPRVLPNGTGQPNPAGLDYYDRLVDELLAANITPFVTLFHWDYPYALYCRGGWLNPDSPDWFASYADLMARRLSDRVPYWTTHNEPQCFIGLGHQTAYHAPGDKLGFKQVLLAAHNVLLAHGKGVQAIRAAAKRPVEVSIVSIGVNAYPATETPADIEAARRATGSITHKDMFNATWWLDPIFLGHYPADGLALFGPDAPEVKPGDMETISQPLDFLGLNIYEGSLVQASATAPFERLTRPAGYPMSCMPWPITPSVLHWAPVFFHERYHTPIMITENGCGLTDWVMLDGQVHDPLRIDYTRRYLLELHKAIESGVPVKGYLHWAFMDNFEWADGFKWRFGLVHTDFTTQKRTPKDSAYWYQKVIASNGGYLTTHPW